MDISVIVRTYNEEVYLPELLQMIGSQIVGDMRVEVVIVDSGSTDKTLQIAADYGCRITHIRKSEFSFGRALNLGCDFADGSYLVMISGHCVPVSNEWLAKLVEPLKSGDAAYVYGRQVGRDTTKISEHQVFAKYFPLESYVSGDNLFCNNANSAISREAWERFKFDENLTGLEDMAMAKNLVGCGLSMAYVSDSVVYHIHNERWYQVRNRYEREAYALQEIMPAIQVTALDALRYFCSAVFFDLKSLSHENRRIGSVKEVFQFRFMQYWGTYRGNHEHRRLSSNAKERYYYPRKELNYERIKQIGSAATDES